MFALKKLLSAVLQPYPVLLAVMLAGLIILCFTKRQRIAKILLAGGLALLALLSLDPVARAIVRPLETTYPPFLAGATQASANLPDGSPAPRWVVVLGGGHAESHSLAPGDRLSSASLVRLAEGIRLQRLLAGSKLVLSGGGSTESTDAQLLAAAATGLGTPEDRTILESQSWDTIDEVRALRAILGTDRFVLVTSATHLPRAMIMFEKAGMNPLPAPTDYLAIDEPWTFYHLLGCIPHANPGVLIERAVHEYLGVAWAKLRGQGR